MAKAKTVKGRTERPALKVMHYIRKDENGNTVYSSKTLQEQPKLREAVGHDVQQAAEETGHKIPSPKDVKAKETVKPKDKDELSDEQRSVLKALHDLGGKNKDIHSMDIAKKLGFDKKFPKAPRAPVRNAMDKLHSLHLVTSKKEGVKYSFRITDRGIEALKAKHNNPNDKEAVPAVKPASNPSVTSERPANTDIQCGKCSTFNPFEAVHCKECGAQLQPVRAAPVAA